MRNNGITVAICDDEERILKELKEYVEQIFYRNSCHGTVLTFQDGKELLEQLVKKQIDILLLDIDMPYIDGMEVARLITEKQLPILLIFVTCKESLVYDSFQYRPFSFIRKSLYQKELESTLLRAFKHLPNRSELTVRQDGALVRLRIADILYCEADGNYVKIVMNTDRIRQRGTLAEMEKQLSPHGFVRIHKGFLVNANAVYRLLSDKVILLNQEELPIGRNGREKARMLLMRSFRI